MNGWRARAERIWDRVGSRVTAVVLLIATAVAAYWVATADRTAEHGRRVELDFLWPTFTPQKVRYGEYLKSRYEELRLDVHINLIKTPDPNKKLDIMIAGRTTPDVAWMGVGWEQYVDALVDMEDVAANDPEVDPTSYFPGLWKAVQWEGRARALPSSGQVGVIYYNKDLFREAGVEFPTSDWTWDDMVRMARALTHDFDGDGTIDQYGVQLGQVYIVPFMLYDGQIADEQWREARVNKPVTAALLERYRDLMHVERVMPTAIASTELGMLPMFEAGRVAMHAASGYAIESFRRAPFDWDVVTLPWFEYEGKKYRATGMWQEEFAVLWDTDEPEEALAFAKFCAGKEMIAWAAQEGHIVPGRMDVGMSDAYLHPGQKPANMSAFIESLAFAVPVYPHPWWRRINAEFGPIMNRFMRGQEEGRLGVDELLSELDSILQEILDEYHAEHED